MKELLGAGDTVTVVGNSETYHFDHAEGAKAEWLRFAQAPGPIVVGAVQGASCFGPAYEFAFIMEADLRRRKRRDKVPMTFVSAEPCIGPLGLGGVGDSKTMLESAMRSKHIKWITNARVAKVEPGIMHVVEHDEDGKPKKEHRLPFAYSMMLPAFKGVEAVFGIEGLVNPRGLVLIDEPQRNPKYPNVYAVGVCVAIPPVEATPVPAGAPKTGFMIESMVTATAHNIADAIAGRVPALRRAEMADLHVDQAARFAEGLMEAQVRAPDPRPGGVVAEFVGEHAVDDEDLLASPVGMCLEAGAGRPADHRHVLAAKFMKGKHGQPRYEAGPPRGVPRVDHDARAVVRTELPQLHEYLAARGRERSMQGARRIPDVGAGRILAVLVGERPGQHEELLAERVFVGGKGRPGHVAHDARGPRDFVADTVEQLSLDARFGRCNPRRGPGVDNDPVFQVGVQFHGRPLRSGAAQRIDPPSRRSPGIRCLLERDPDTGDRFGHGKAAGQGCDPFFGNRRGRSGEHESREQRAQGGLHGGGLRCHRSGEWKTFPANDARSAIPRRDAAAMQTGITLHSHPEGSVFPPRGQRVQQPGPQQGAGFTARMKALTNLPSISRTTASSTKPSAARKVRASSLP